MLHFTPDLYLHQTYFSLPMKTPETHTRYRVQRLIRMGEWLERNEAAIVLAYDVIDEAHNKMIDADETSDPNDLIDVVGMDQLQALLTLRPIIMDLRLASDWDVKRGTDVTLHQPYAAPGKKHQVVIEAPKLVVDNTPTNEEFNKVRSEVDV